MNAARRALWGVACVVCVASCVPPVSRVEAPVRGTLRSYLGADPRAVDDATVREILAQPLTRVSVTRLALASPRALAALDSLGIVNGTAAAARSLGQTSIDVGANLTSDGSLMGLHGEMIQDVLDLVLAAPRRKSGDALLAAGQARATATILTITARADDAFLAVAAATDAATIARLMFDAANASAEFASRAHAAGATTDLALAREESLREEARLTVARAETEVEIARTAFDAALGLSGDATQWTLGEGLPDIPAAPPSFDDLEATAVAASLELAALRADALGAANRARTADVAAWLPELGLGVSVEYHDGNYYPGPAVRLALPLFSGERGRAAAERATTRHVERLTTVVAVELRANARATRMQALAAYDEARHVRDVLVPLRQRVLDETVLQYNAMNASPYDLLLARRELATSERELVTTRRRFASAMRAVETLRRGASLPLATSDTAVNHAPEPARSQH